MAKDDLPIEKIKKLSEILQEQNLTEIEVEAEGLKIKVRKEASPIIGTTISANPSPNISGSAATESKNSASGEKLYEVKSPMVGTFYAAASPDSAPFVKAGSKIKKGDSLCIIEAMKLMNEVPAEVDGEVVEVLVKNSEAISFGQVLMKVRLS